MDRKRVGVFPCGSEVGLEIHRSLKYYRHFELFGLSSTQDHGRVTFKNYVSDIPFITSENFIEKLKVVLEKHSIDFLIPAMDEAGYLLKKNEKSLNCEIVYPELGIAEIIRNKTKTYKALEDVIPVPDVFTKEEAISNLPVFIKPDIGYGSRNARLISEKNDLIQIGSDNIQYIISENLPGDEFTIDCFSDDNHKVIFSGSRKRERVRMGISVASSSAPDQKLYKQFAEKISHALKMKGVWFFQLKEAQDGSLKLLEVAGRVSGSMAYYRSLGVNFIAADLFQRLGYPVSLEFLNLKNTALERSFDCVLHNDFDYAGIYCDLDDCLILEDKFVNTSLVTFLYQSFNQNKKLILITRHARDPLQTLKNHRMDSLFDKIIHIKDSKNPKSNFIEHKDFIFVDDSFRERSDVYKVHGMKVFAPDAIPMLIQKDEF